MTDFEGIGLLKKIKRIDPNEPDHLYILAEVIRVEEKFRTEPKKVDGKWEMINISTGWFVQFSGSMESLFFGMERPDIQVGDKYRILFERLGAENAKSQPTPK